MISYCLTSLFHFVGFLYALDFANHPDQDKETFWVKFGNFTNLDFPEIASKSHMGVSKNKGNTPKMDGENNGKPY